VPIWPLGATLIQYCFINNEWQNLADVLDLFIRTAQAVLRTKEGAYAYLVGSPMYHNTLALKLPAGHGPGITKDEFVFPIERFPYLPHILGINDIDLCGPNLAEIVDNAAQRAFEMKNAFRTEPEEPCEWINGAIAGISTHTIPVSPGIIQIREGWLGR
jgi:hypothetical protein